MMYGVLLLALVSVAGAAPFVPEAARALYNPGLWEGDIKGVAGQEPGEEKSAIIGQQYLWQDGVIPYILAGGSDAEILAAMDEIMSKTCLKFIARSVGEPNYIRITTNGDGVPRIIKNETCLLSSYLRLRASKVNFNAEQTTPITFLRR